MKWNPLIASCMALCAVSAWGASIPATQPKSLGPDVVILKELETLYEPVPFDHRGHAQMAEMWAGCETCHHRTPTWRGADSERIFERTQDSAARAPRCKSCHRISEETVRIRMPNLKGAYHRQCLNCHKEWMHDNACVICHKPKDPKIAAVPTSPAPTVDDITGRMHPPIAAPEAKAYKARFTPAVGANVLFRHKEHTDHYGLKCASCHRRDSCGDCHDGRPHMASPPVRPGRTWKDTHAPCVSCHQQDRCAHCHYKEGDAPPLPFDHRSTGQALDADHLKLKCGECHSFFRSKQALSCGPTACHSRPNIAYPRDKPGPVTATPAVAMKRLAVTRPSVQATTRQFQMRRGGGT